MVWKMYKKMSRLGVVPNNHIYNVLVSSCLLQVWGDVEKAEQLLSEMELKCIFPDLFTFNTLISLYCKKGMNYEALSVQDGWKEEGTNDLDEALKLRELMEAKGLYPGVVTYNSILRKLCEEGRIRDANKFLNEMSEKKVEPDNVTCNTLINAYGKIGDMGSAMKVKNKMLESGLKLDQYTYRALIHGFCKVQEMDSVKELLFSMLDAGFHPSC